MDGARSPVARLRRGLQDLAYGNRLYSWSLGWRAPRELALVPPDTWPGDAERGAALIGGLYRFAGQRVQADRPPWRGVGLAEDFLAELHTFDWLRDLRALGGDAARRHARLLVGSWVEQHDRWDPLAWRPDILGQRIANWLGVHDFFCASAEDEFRARVFTSLTCQTRHLMRVGIGDVSGVALIAALKGMILGGLAISETDNRLATALRHLDHAIADQVLPDGGHVQRNPSAHLAVLRHLIDIRGALRAGKLEVPETLQHAIDRMAPALRFFRHGDGRLPLFNGSDEGDRLLIETVLTQADARGRPLRTARHSGFERILAGRTLIILDAGQPPAPGLDDGAHAGLLSFELSVGRERMIVNCGSWPGRVGREAQAWREALRGTAAHSTLTVEHTDQLSLIEGDGVRRRPANVVVERTENDGATLIEAAHDGYRPKFGLEHARRLWVGPDGEDIRGEDVLTGDADRSFAIRFHLHPTVKASAVQNGAAALIVLAGGSGWRLRAVGAEMSVEESVYLGAGEPARKSSQVVLTGRTAADQTIVKWALTRERKA